MEISSFERLARSVQAENVCKPARCLDVNPCEDTVGSILREHAHTEHKEHEPDAPLLLRIKQSFDDDGSPIFFTALPYGVLLPDRAWYDAIEQSEGGERYLDYSIFDGDFLDAPSPAIARFTEKNILAGNVSLWEILTSDSFAISADGAALVVRGIGEYGVITIKMLLEQPEAKACWLTAALELEQSALHLCKQHITQSVKSLPPKRLEAAGQLFKQRRRSIKNSDQELWLGRLLLNTDINVYFGKITSDNILEDIFSLLMDYTQFADKKIMLLKGNFSLKASKSKIKDVFDRAERLRNWCAHPTAEPELQFEHLGHLRILLMNIHNLTKEIREEAARLRS